jgi:hypothetical protein
VKIIDSLQRHWSLVITMCSIICASAVFLRDVLTIRKLSHEIKTLKAANEAKKSVIVTATMDEIERYAVKYPQVIMHAMPPSFFVQLVESFGILFVSVGFASVCVSAAFLLSFWFSAARLILPYTFAVFGFVTLTVVLIARLDLAVTKKLIRRLRNNLDELA